MSAARPGVGPRGAWILAACAALLVAGCDRLGSLGAGSAGTQEAKLEADDAPKKKKKKKPASDEPAPDPPAAPPPPAGTEPIVIDNCKLLFPDPLERKGPTLFDDPTPAIEKPRAFAGPGAKFETISVHAEFVSAPMQDPREPTKVDLLTVRPGSDEVDEDRRNRRRRSEALRRARRLTRRRRVEGGRPQDRQGRALAAQGRRELRHPHHADQARLADAVRAGLRDGPDGDGFVDYDTRGKMKKVRARGE